MKISLGWKKPAAFPHIFLYLNYLSIWHVCCLFSLYFHSHLDDHFMLSQERMFQSSAAYVQLSSWPSAHRGPDLHSIVLFQKLVQVISRYAMSSDPQSILILESWIMRLREGKGHWKAHRGLQTHVEVSSTFSSAASLVQHIVWLLWIFELDGNSGMVCHVIRQKCCKGEKWARKLCLGASNWNWYIWFWFKTSFRERIPSFFFFF